MLKNDFQALQSDIHMLAKDKGFHTPPRDPAVSIALMHSELSELLEAYRNRTAHQPCDKNIPFQRGLLRNAEEELADLVIRAMDFAEEQGIDLWGAMMAKHRYNVQRPHKHGKQF